MSMATFDINIHCLVIFLLNRYYLVETNKTLYFKKRRRTLLNYASSNIFYYDLKYNNIFVVESWVERNNKI